MSAGELVEASVAPPLEDVGLRCPACTYNLTGLTSPRCPECGRAFDWEQVRRAAANQPRIAFERARGSRKILGLGLTWLTVLFAPWVFARQITARVSTGHALVFLAVCFASGLLSFFFGADTEVILAWLMTAVVYILLQAVWLALLDPTSWRSGGTLLVSPSRWRRFFGSLHFWLLIGCYTSAVMATEFVSGPPFIELTTLLEVVRGRDPSSWISGAFKWSFYAVVTWAQMLVWLLGLGFCYAARLRRAGTPAGRARGVAVLIVLSLLVLYAAVFEQVGERMFDLFDDWL
ncbi:MAG: hypothetical protein KKB50_09605 [Planctomycetes bacterium]|nr:hypothetical protein [Planctomycetota bacterium]